MCKTALISYKYFIYPSTTSVENLWKNPAGSGKLFTGQFSHRCSQAQFPIRCGKVYNFSQMQQLKALETHNP